jgi:hypothetical protein
MRFLNFRNPPIHGSTKPLGARERPLLGPRLVQWPGLGQVSVSEADEPQDLEPMQDRPALVARRLLIEEARDRMQPSIRCLAAPLPPLGPRTYGRRVGTRTYGRRVGTRSVPKADTGWDRRLRRAAPRRHGPRHALQPSPRSNAVRWRSVVRLHLREQIAQDVMPGCAVAVDIHREDASRDPVFLCEELRGKGVDL